MGRRGWGFRRVERPNPSRERVFRRLERAFRSLERSFRSIEMPSRSFEMPNRSMEMAFRSIETTNRSMEMPFRSIEMTNPSLEMTVPSFETVFPTGLLNGQVAISRPLGQRSAKIEMPFRSFETAFRFCPVLCRQRHAVPLLDIPVEAAIPYTCPTGCYTTGNNGPERGPLLTKTQKLLLRGREWA
jgi:hypothetical protein